MYHAKKIRLSCLLLAMCIALSMLVACGVQDEPADPVIADDPAILPEEPIEPDPVPVEPEEPALPEEPEVDPDLFVADGNVNPLTGLCDGISDEALEHRPLAIMINNMIKALPQWGISQADIIYEMLAEGRITRLLAIFQDYSKIDVLGSIRSARPYYMDIAQSYGAVYIHFGGSEPAYNEISKRSDLVHIDGIKGTWNDTFYRDPDRKASMGLEHSVVTTGEKLADAMTILEKKGYDLNQTEHPSAFRYSERLSENSAMNGEPAEKVTITYSNSHKPWFEYDAESGKYLRFEYGDPQMDGKLDTQIATENVLVLRMETTDVPNSYLHLIEIKTTGTGAGYYFHGGKYVPITWSKDSYNSEIKYYDENGEELILARGQTFISVITKTGDIVIE